MQMADLPQPSASNGTSAVEEGFPENPDGAFPDEPDGQDETRVAPPATSNGTRRVFLGAQKVVAPSKANHRQVHPDEEAP